MPNQASFTAATPGAVVQGTVTDKLPVLPGTPPTGRTAIGPRITPNFITDPWSSDNSYQYYDVVLVDGASYIARKAVPAGIQITNTEYWIRWADSNTQFQELQNTVQTFDGRITENADAIATEVERATAAEATKAPVMHASANDTYGVGTNANYGHLKLADTASDMDVTDGTAATPKMVTRQKAMLAIGDSFGVDSVTSPVFWHTVVAQGLGLTDLNYCEGSTGFATKNPMSNRNFEANVVRAYNDDSFNNEDVEFIVCYGGLNDHTQTGETPITSAIVSFANKCHELYPKAKLVIAGCNSWYAASPVPSYNNGYGSFNLFMEHLLQDQAGNAGYAFCDVTFACIGYESYFAGTSDGYHFTQAGSKAAGAAILASMYGNGFATKLSTYNDCVVKKQSDDTQVGTADITVKRYHDGLMITGSATIEPKLESNTNIYIVTPCKLVLNITQDFGSIGMEKTDRDVQTGFPTRVQGANGIGKDGAMFRIVDLKTSDTNQLCFFTFRYYRW